MTLQRKIYLSLLTVSAFSFMACGKKAMNTDPNADDPRFITDTPALTGNSIKLTSSIDTDGNVTSNEFYQFEQDAWLKVPEFIFVESGAPLNYTARVYFNTDKVESFIGHRELFCEYRSAKQIGEEKQISFDGYYHHFVGCFEDLDQDGNPERINYNPGSQVAQDKNNFIRIEYVDGFTDNPTQISADLDIEWF